MLTVSVAWGLEVLQRLLTHYEKAVLQNGEKVGEWNEMRKKETRQHTYIRCSTLHSRSQTSFDWGPRYERVSRYSSMYCIVRYIPAQARERMIRFRSACCNDDIVNVLHRFYMT